MPLTQMTDALAMAEPLVILMIMFYNLKF